MALGPILTSLISLAFPKLPAWVLALLLSLISRVMAAVREAEALTDEYSGSRLTGREKYAYVADNIEAFLSEDTNEIPGWKELNPERRRKITGGLIELSVLAVDLSDGRLDSSNSRPKQASLRELLRRRKG